MFLIFKKLQVTRTSGILKMLPITQGFTLSPQSSLCSAFQPLTAESDLRQKGWYYPKNLNIFLGGVGVDITQKVVNFFSL